MGVCLLDTNVIIDALNEKKNRTGLLLNLLEQGHILACCAISVAEVYSGLRPKEEQRTTELLRSLKLIPITFEVAELGGRLRQSYSRRGRTLTIADTLIAAVAIHNGLILLTDNVKDFPMSELQIYPMAGADRLPVLMENSQNQMTRRGPRFA